MSYRNFEHNDIVPKIQPQLELANHVIFIIIYVDSHFLKTAPLWSPGAKT